MKKILLPILILLLSIAPVHAGDVWIDGVEQGVSSGGDVGDDAPLNFGASNDVQFQWDTTQTNDSLQIGTTVGSASGSGAVSIMEKADIGNANRDPESTLTNPTLRVYSADEAQSRDYIEIYHDQGDGVIGTLGGSTIHLNSSGDITLSAAGGDVVRKISSTNVLRENFNTTFDQFTWGVYDAVGNQIVLANGTVGADDFDHAAQTNPTLFIQSDTDPDTDNTQWISLTHDQTNGVINAGSGNITSNTNLSVDGGTGSYGVIVDGSTGGCIMFRDTDDAGWTEVTFLNGTMTSTTDADGVCDGS